MKLLKSLANNVCTANETHNFSMKMIGNLNHADTMLQNEKNTFQKYNVKKTLSIV